MPSSADMAVLDKTDYREWARTVRKQRPPASPEEHLKTVEAFFDHYSLSVESWQERNSGYHQALSSLAGFYIPPGMRVLEIGSGTGNLLASTKPSRGLGIDISGEMTRIASARHPDLEFRHMSGDALDLDEQFDYIILSDLVGFLYDIRLVFERLRAACHPRTRILIHWYSRLWQPVLSMAEKLGLKYPQPLVNWTTPEDIVNLLYLADFEVVLQQKHILLPKRIPLISAFVNRFLAHLPAIRQLCLTNWIVARPKPQPVTGPLPSVSVICPCRNESRNIQQIVERLPSMGSNT